MILSGSIGMFFGSFVCFLCFGRIAQREKKLKEDAKESKRIKEKLYQSKCLPDGAGQKKKKVSVFDEGTAAKLSAHLDLPKREKTCFKIYFSKKKQFLSEN